MIKYFLNIPSITNLEKKYVNDVLKKGWLSSNGEHTNIFEKKFRLFLKRKFSLAVQSGTASIHVALKALGVIEEIVAIAVVELADITLLTKLEVESSPSPPNASAKVIVFECTTSEEENSCCILLSFTLSSLVVKFTFAIIPEVAVVLPISTLVATNPEASSTLNITS